MRERGGGEGVALSSSHQAHPLMCFLMRSDDPDAIDAHHHMHELDYMCTLH